MMGWNRTRTVAELHAARPPLAGTHVRAACTGRGDEGQREPPEMAAVARTYNMLPLGPLIPTCTWTWGKLDQIQIAIEHRRLAGVRTYGATHRHSWAPVAGCCTSRIGGPSTDHSPRDERMVG
jgi:hypothetical protein